MAETSQPLKAQSAKPWLLRFLLPASVLVVLLVLGAAGGLGWYSLNNPCDPETVQKTSTILMGQMRRYDDVYMVTTGASPTLVLLPVSVLQQIYMDTQQIAVPVCMQTAKDELLEYMSAGIRAFQAYAAGDEDAVIIGLLDEAYQHIQVFFGELEKVKECAPLCLPW